MLKFLLGKFKDAPGPLKQTRLIAGDLAEEVIDLVGHYIKRSRTESDWDSPNYSSNSQTDSPNNSNESTSTTTSSSTAKKQQPKPVLVRTIDVPEILETALDNQKNKKKQEFKILTILWDASERNMGTLSAKGVSDRGVLLGLAIRHENVRKVIRMRLGKYVETLTEQIGNNRIYRYKISETGISYFVSKYLNQTDQPI